MDAAPGPNPRARQSADCPVQTGGGGQGCRRCCPAVPAAAAQASCRLQPKCSVPRPDATAVAITRFARFPSSHWAAMAIQHTNTPNLENTSASDQTAITCELAVGHPTRSTPSPSRPPLPLSLPRPLSRAPSRQAGSGQTPDDPARTALGDGTLEGNPARPGSHDARCQ